MGTNSQTNTKPPHIRRLLQSPPAVLNGFHHEDLLDFLSIGIKEEYAGNDLIVDKSDYVNSAYLVCEGEVGIWEDNIELTTLPVNSFLGEAFLFGDAHRMARIVAVTDTVMLRFQRQDMLMFFKQKPTKLFNIFTRNIIHVQQQKLKDTNQLILKLKKKLIATEN